MPVNVPALAIALVVGLVPFLAYYGYRYRTKRAMEAVLEEYGPDRPCTHETHAKCPDCKGTLKVPYVAPPDHDMTSVILRARTSKRLMMEHLAGFLSQQEDGQIVLERLLADRTFLDQKGRAWRIRIEPATRGKTEPPKNGHVADAEDDGEVPREVPA